MTTKNLSILTAAFNSAGQRICTVYACDPLYIKELIIVPYPTQMPIGVLKPGTPDAPVVRTIFVNSQDAALTTPAPFTLTVTYDDNYKLIAPLGVAATAIVQAATVAFSFMPPLNANDAAVYVTQAVAAITAQIQDEPEDQPAGDNTEPDPVPEAVVRAQQNGGPTATARMSKHG